MEEAPPPLPVHPRWYDLLAGAVVAGFYAVLWWLLPPDWLEVHVGGKGFLLVFVPLSGAAAVLTSVFLFNRDLTTREAPAALLAAQVIFWNPITFRAVLGAAGAVGAGGLAPGVLALVGLVMLSLPISLVGMFLCRNGWWSLAYTARAIQAFFATWLPLIPALMFLHVLMLAQITTWKQHGAWNRAAVALVLAEQVAAFFWVLLFYEPGTG